MKRIAHFRGYDATVEYDQKSQSFFSQPLNIMNNQQKVEESKIAQGHAPMLKKVKKQNAHTRLYTEPAQ